MKRAAWSERGASLPESAVVMTVLLAMIFGVIEFGRLMYTYAFVAQIAREGARWAIVRGNQCSLLDHCNAAPSDIQTYVRSLNEGATNSGNIGVTASWPSAGCPPGVSGNSPGCTVVVTVTYPFYFFAVKLLGVPTQVSLSSTSQMIISQ